MKWRKRVMSILLAGCMTATMLPAVSYAANEETEQEQNVNLTAEETQEQVFAVQGEVVKSAQSAATSGTCGENLTWTLDDEGTLTISGTGAMTEYSDYSSVPWYQYIETTGLVTSVKIEEGVTSISPYAFYTHYGDYKNVTEIEIPSSITVIPHHAFYGWDGLEKVILSDDLIEIGTSAFGFCRKLTYLELPKTMQRIGSYAFANSGLTTIYGYANSYAETYAKNNNLSFVKLGSDENPSIISKGACGDNITWILDTSGKLYISGTGAMTEYSDYSSVPWYQYIETTGLVTSVKIEEGVTSISPYAFYTHYGDYKNVTEIEIPSSITVIPHHAFYGWDGLEKVILSDDLIEIRSSAFNYCDSLKNVYYSGSGEDWKAISIDSGNDPLVNATIHYNSSGETAATQSILTLDDVWGFNMSGLGTLQYKHYWKFFPIPGYCGQLYKKDDGKDGLCAGMVTSAIAASGYNSPPAESFVLSDSTKASVLNDIKDSSSVSEVNRVSAADYIKYAYVYQSTPLIIIERNSHINDLDKLYSVIKKSVEGNGDYIEINIRGRYKGIEEGHVLLAMGISYDTDSEVEILVYDGNFPNELKKFYLYKDNGEISSWKYNVAGFLDWGTGKDYAEISYTTSGDNFANDMFSTWYDKANLDMYNYLLSVKNRNINVTAGENNQNLKADTDENILPIKTSNAVLNAENLSSEENYLYWIKPSGELTFENGDTDNTIEIASAYESVKAEIPKSTILSVDTESGNGSYANINNISSGDTFQLEFKTYAEDTENEGESEPESDTIVIRGTASDDIEAKKNIDGSVDIDGAESIEVYITDSEGNTSSTASSNPNGAPVTITSNDESIHIHIWDSGEITNAITGITLNKTTLSLVKGDSQTLTATVTPSNATNKTVTWTSSNTSVATVSNGKVTAVAAGTASITAKTSNGKTATCKVTVTAPISSIFIDIQSDAWYVNAVQYVYDNGIMSGSDIGTFMPLDTMNRAMVVQTLYNLAGQPEVSGKLSFSDVKPTDWYYNAVLWAEQNNVAAGSDGKFMPNTNVTREQFAQFLYNDAGKPKVSGSLNRYPDAAAVSDWAVSALTWANQNGIVNGKSNGGKLTLDPQGLATRAEAASMLMNYIEE